MVQRCAMEFFVFRTVESCFSLPFCLGDYYRMSRFSGQHKFELSQVNLNAISVVVYAHAVSRLCSRPQNTTLAEITENSAQKFLTFGIFSHQVITIEYMQFLNLQTTESFFTGHRFCDLSRCRYSNMWSYLRHSRIYRCYCRRAPLMSACRRNNLGFPKQCYQHQCLMVMNIGNESFTR